jgi:hypothetical protein
LKLVVPEVERDRLLSALNADRQDARSRQLYLFDSSDLTLARNGLVVRARRIRGSTDDCTVKLRHPYPVALPPKMRRSRNLNLEMDVLRRSSIWSAALTCPVGPSIVRAVVAGRRPVWALLSADQQTFFRRFAGRDVQVHMLSAHGPIEITRTPARVAHLPTKLMIECWTYPDGSRLLELTTKCKPAHATRVAAGIGRFLVDRGIDVTAQQKTKTERSVDYFTR